MNGKIDKTELEQNENISLELSKMNILFNFKSKTLVKPESQNYTKMPYYTTLQFHDQIKDIILEYIQSIFPKNVKIKLIDKLYDIWWKDLDNTRDYIAHVKFVNLTNFISTSLVVNFSINKHSIHKLDDFTIKYIIVEDNTIKNTLSPYIYNDNYVYFNNTLFLSEPFLTN